MQVSLSVRVCVWVCECVFRAWAEQLNNAKENWTDMAHVKYFNAIYQFADHVQHQRRMVGEGYHRGGLFEHWLTAAVGQKAVQLLVTSSAQSA